jgi:tryptophanyl-tRNA synthetase
MKLRSFSGIKPTGEQPHLGNYFGMMKPCIEAQDSYENIVFLANYHALTTMREGEKLRQYTFETALTFLSLGLDPEKSILFRQSDVPEVTELSWILSCFTSMGLLERAHAYKDSVAKGVHDITAGLFTYPVLMAADILLYGSHRVPVGKDQKQHVEIARDIAERFNHYYGETFILPEPVIEEEMTIIGTDGQKMSKSYQNTIMLFEEEETMRKKLKAYQTDPARIKKTDPGSPAKCPAYSLHELFTPTEACTTIQTECRLAQRGCVACKSELADNVLAYLAPFRAKRAELLKNPDYIEEVLKKGADKAKAMAQETMADVRRKTGL